MLYLMDLSNGTAIFDKCFWCQITAAEIQISNSIFLHILDLL